MKQQAHATHEQSLWKRNRALRIVVFLMLGCLAAGALFVGITNAVVIDKASKRMITADESTAFNADAIIVLGAYVHPDGTPSDILKDRLDNAVELYDADVAPKIIMSGDHGTVSYNEVQAMKQYAIDKGVPADDIFCDHAGFSTYETMHRAKNVFGADRVVVSTQTYHMYRALYDALGVGLDAVGVPADRHVFQQQLMWDMREVAARSKDVLQVLTGAEPTFGGEPISLDEPGSVTNG